MAAEDGDLAARRRAEADEKARRGSIARQVARSFDEAQGRDRLTRALLELEPLGWTVMTGRRWPVEVETADPLKPEADIVLVGPGGVIVVEATELADLRVGADHVSSGDVDATDEVAAFADRVYGLQGALAEVGLAPGEVVAYLVPADAAGELGRLYGVEVLGEAAAVLGVARRSTRLDLRKVAAVRTALARLMPASAEELDTADIPVVAPNTAAEPLAAADVETALTDAAASEAVDEWMSFLHPEQARLARRSFSGPARVRGAAGTGKTAVALHRAAYLARTTAGRVLVTSYVRTLPRVMAERMAHLAPDVADRIEFASVHAVARRILTERRGPVPVDAPLADEVFQEIWIKMGIDTPLAQLDAAHQYWLQELHHVIKGRGLTSFEDYAELARTGRRRPLNRDQRAAMWRLYVAYENEMRRRGILDWDDLVLEAEASLRAEPLDRYDAVIVDEAQDLSCATLRMLHELVGDRPDGLLLVADGRQAIYPGGYTLAEAGISIAGRGAVLTTDFRSTREIAEFAATLLHDQTPIGIEGEADETPATALRHGPEPVRHTFESKALHDESFVERVRSIQGAGGRLGDIGVLALSNLVAQEASTVLERAGIPTVELDKFDGKPVDAVKVGTVKRAKGLEFTDVLVVRTPLHLVQPLSGDVDPAVMERRDLQRRELYVAMSRARERLWIGVA